MILLTSLVAAMAVFLFVTWYVLSKAAMDTRIRSLSEQQRVLADPGDPFGQRVAFPVVDGIVRRVMAVMPTSLVGRARGGLVIAGDKLTTVQFFTIVLVSSTLMPAVYFMLAWIGTAGHPSVAVLIPAFILVPTGFFLPFILLRRIAKARQKKIWRSMPNSIDLLTTCVEAGLSLDFGLQRVSERYSGPLSDELQRALHEIGLGKTRREALIDMANRVELPDLVTFVNSIVQAEDLGTSVGQVLRIQAGQMREKRRQRAEQMARRAPVKMVFPLVLFLMPSLFIVTIGPVVLNVIKAISES